MAQIWLRSLAHANERGPSTPGAFIRILESDTSVRACSDLDLVNGGRMAPQFR